MRSERPTLSFTSREEHIKYLGGLVEKGLPVDSDVVYRPEDPTGPKNPCRQPKLGRFWQDDEPVFIDDLLDTDYMGFSDILYRIG